MGIHYFPQNTLLATFWAIFSQTHLVTLLTAQALNNDENNMTLPHNSLLPQLRTDGEGPAT
jgi:hypothetical protein